METIELRYQSLKKALITLKESLNVVNDKAYEKVYTQLRDSVIQRFEYCIDSFWKFLKLYLEIHKQSSFQFVSPSVIIRESVNSNVITPQEQIVFLRSIADRNLTSDSYAEETAEAILERISERLYHYGNSCF